MIRAGLVNKLGAQQRRRCRRRFHDGSGVRGAEGREERVRGGRGDGGTHGAQLPG